jgi:hypothetical protein
MAVNPRFGKNVIDFGQETGELLPIAFRWCAGAEFVRGCLGWRPFHFSANLQICAMARRLV